MSYRPPGRAAPEGELRPVPISRYRHSRKVAELPPKPRAWRPPPTSPWQGEEPRSARGKIVPHPDPSLPLPGGGEVGVGRARPKSLPILHPFPPRARRNAAQPCGIAVSRQRAPSTTNITVVSDKRQTAPGVPPVQFYLQALTSLSMAAVLPLSDTVRDGRSVPLSVTPTSLPVFNNETIGPLNST